MKKILILLLVCFLSGCGFLNITCRTGIPYSGTIEDAVVIAHPTLSLAEWLLIKPIYVIDLPFTVMFDTLLLPFLIL